MPLNAVKQVHYAPAAPSFAAAAANSEVPRFIMVRNPYSRLLSGYLEKVLRVEQYKEKLQRTGHYFRGDLCGSFNRTNASARPVAGFALFAAR